MKEKNNKIINFISYFIIISTTIISAALIVKSAQAYPVQYGGRIIYTLDISICVDPLTAAACNFCGPGPWYQVVIQPYGGSGFFICPTFPAQIGNAPLYPPGAYLMTGGTEAHILDPSNTGVVLGKIKGTLLLAWFKLLDILPQV